MGSYIRLVRLTLDSVVTYQSSLLCGVVFIYAGVRRDGIYPKILPFEIWSSSLSWQSEQSMPISVRAGVLVGIWPLPSFPRGQDKGEPKRSSMVVWRMQWKEKGVVVEDQTWCLARGLHGLGMWSAVSGPWPAGSLEWLTNRCLEIPGVS